MYKSDILPINTGLFLASIAQRMRQEISLDFIKNIPSVIMQLLGMFGVGNLEFYKIIIGTLVLRYLQLSDR